MGNLKNNILEIKEGCTGCGVCSIICPKKCIEIKENNFGFYEPNIKDGLCIQCGICKNVCYKFINDDTKNEFSIYDSKGHLAFSKDKEIRRNSSSGGIGTEISKVAIKKEYEVVGVKYDFDHDRAKHIIISNLNGIDKIIGSKYIPSYTVEAFENLDKNKKYIVFGTPCQIYGLRKYQQIKKINNLILVDFFCHGAPSLKMWDKYIKNIKRNNNVDKIKKISFRDKTFGWHNFSMKIEGENINYLTKSNKDIFFDFFLKNLCLPISCYDCKLRFNKIYSDIRIGDFWGNKCKKDELGTSIVLSNTKMGENLIKELENVYIEEVKFHEIKESQYIEKLNVPKTRKQVLNDLNSEMNINKLYKKYIRNDKLKEKIKWKIKNILK